MPKKHHAVHDIRHEIEELYESYYSEEELEWQEESSRPFVHSSEPYQHRVEEWQELDTKRTSETKQTMTFEAGISRVKQVLSDSFSIEAIHGALERVQLDPDAAIGLLLDEAVDTFQSSIPLEESQLQTFEDETSVKDVNANVEQTTEKEIETKLNAAVFHRSVTSKSNNINSQSENIASEYLKGSSSNSGHQKSSVILVLGHVDVGKSTFLGHLLHLTGNVDERFFRRLKKESIESGYSDVSYAWILDDLAAEREHGVTMDISIRHVTWKQSYTFIDAPGHQDFIPSVITAASQAQVAILLLDAAPGQFEASIQENGQTLQHAIILKSMGVSKVIVAVNKMDQIDYNEKRFQAVKEKIVKILTVQVGYGLSQVVCVPCSGLTGENVVTREELKLSSWYSGDTVLETVEKFCLKTIEEKQDDIFRMPCVEVAWEKKGNELLRISGCIMSGQVKVGDIVQIHPFHGNKISVRSITCGALGVNTASEGDWTSLLLSGVTNTCCSVGSVVTSLECACSEKRYIKAQITVFATGKKPLLRGTPIMLHVHCFQDEAVITELISVTRRKESEKKEINNPRYLMKNDRAVVVIRTERPMFATPSYMNRRLSRIMIQQESDIVASGVIMEVLENAQ